MACQCRPPSAPQYPDSKFRSALWIALVINLAMFVVELIGGHMPTQQHCGQML